MPLQMTADARGGWHFHLSRADASHVGLCGRHTLQTARSVATWNDPPRDASGAPQPCGAYFCRECDALKET